MNEENTNEAAAIPYQNAILEGLIARMVALTPDLASLHGQALGTPENDAQEAMYDAYTGRVLPELFGAAGNLDTSGAVAALVFGRAVLPVSAAEGRASDARLAFQIGRVFLQAQNGPDRDLLLLAAFHVARENARNWDRALTARKERSRQNGRLIEAFAHMTPEARAALLA